MMTELVDRESKFEFWLVCYAQVHRGTFPLHLKCPRQGNRYTAMAIRRASEVASVEQIDRRQGNPHRTLRLNPFPDRNTTNGRLTDCWLTVRLGGSGLGLLRRPEESVGAGIGGVGDGGAGGDPVADDRGRGGRLLQLVGGGGGLLVEDDGPRAAREKRERKVLRS